MRTHSLIPLELLLTLLVGSLVSPVCAQISYLERGVEYQKLLLDYFSRQLIAHGAMLFAASAATCLNICYIQNHMSLIIGSHLASFQKQRRRVEKRK